MIQKEMMMYAKKYGIIPVLVQVTLLQLLNVVINIVIAFEIAQLFSALFYVQKVVLDMYYILYIGLIIAIKFGCHYYSTKLTHYTSFELKHKVRRELFEKLLSLTPQEITKLEISKISQLAVEGIENIDVYYSRYLPQFFYSLLTPVLLFVVMAKLNWKIALMLLISGFLIPVAIVAGVKIGKRIFKTYWNKYLDVGKKFVEGVEGLRTLKIYNGEKAYEKIMNKEAEEFRCMTMKVLRMQLQSITIMDLIAYLGAALGIVCSVIAYKNGNLSLTGFICFSLLAIEFFVPFRLLGSYFHVGMNGTSALNLLSSILKIDSQKEETTVYKDITGDLCIKNITYTYPDADKPALQGCNLVIKQSEVTGIAGASGAGKTTITHILQRFIEPENGTIEIGGTSLAEMPIDQVHRLIGCVSNRSYIFEGTIFSNLMMAKPTLEAEEAEEIIRFVKLDQFAANLHYKIQSGGTNLSSGQRQKLAIARMLLKNPKVFIFDEATANIDRSSEDDILDIIQKISRQGKMVIMITHHLQRLVDANQIYVFSNGKIAEQGDHQTLMNNGNIYAELFEEQQSIGRCAV